MRNNIADARHSYALTRPDSSFTQSDAAKLFGVSVHTYKKWEQGQGKLNGEILCSIADAFGCTTDYLLCRTDRPNNDSFYNGLHVSTNEAGLIRMYRSTDKRGRENILAIARMQMGVEEQSETPLRRTAQG